MAKKRKTILFLIGSLGRGGAEKVLCDIVNNLNHDVYDITVMTIVNQGIYISKLDAKVHYKSATSRNMTFWDRTKVRLIHKNPFIKLTHRLLIGDGYDIEVAFLEGVTAKIIAGANGKTTKKIAWVHTDISEFPQSIKSIGGSKKAEKIYRNYEKVCCVSDRAGQSMIHELRIPEDKIIIQNNPIDTEKIKEATKEKSQKEPGEFRIVTVGRLEYEKGFERLIACAAALKDKYNFSIYIIGEGSLRDRLLQQIKNEHLEERVILCGFLENPYSVIGSADLFVCSSRVEGFPLAVCEAVVLEIPCLSTKCGGPEEILEGGVYGMLVDNSYEGLVGGLEYMLKHPDRLTEMRKKSRERGKKFKLKETMRKIESIL